MIVMPLENNVSQNTAGFNAAVTGRAAYRQSELHANPNKKRKKKTVQIVDSDAPAKMFDFNDARQVYSPTNNVDYHGNESLALHADGGSMITDTYSSDRDDKLAHDSTLRHRKSAG